MGLMDALGGALGGFAKGLGSAFDDALGAFGRGAKAREPKEMLTPPTETRPHEAPAPTITGWTELAPAELGPVPYEARRDEPTITADADIAPVPSRDGVIVDPDIVRRFRAGERDAFGEYLDKWSAGDLERFLGEWKIPLIITGAVVA